MILKLVQSLLEKFTLCTSCLGRQFGTLLSETSNRKRGEALLLSLGLEMHQKILTHKTEIIDMIPLVKTNFKPILSIIEKFPELKESVQSETSCYICQGLFSNLELDIMVNKIVAHANNYEFNTFLVGSILNPEMEEREDEIRTSFGLQFGEALKSSYNRSLGKSLLPELLDKQVEFNRPDILFLVDVQKKFVQVNSNPIFIAGNYRKLVRGIPQAIWHCSKCRGKGCQHCNFSGRNYPDAVEEYITPYFLRVCKGRDIKFHCSGREDVDALMLGTGRPFVVEIRQPKIRNLNLAAIENQINSNAIGRVDVSLTGITNKIHVRNIKGQSRRMAKRYRMKISTENVVNLNSAADKLKTEIQQKTPTRVLHRRADLNRIRQVFDVKIKKLSPNILEVDVYCEGGLYVKELMHGDNGRTKPNLASILNTPVKVHYLDVLKVESLPN